jgi:hypothetical protein
VTLDPEASAPARLRAVTPCSVDGFEYGPGDTFSAEATVAVELLIDGLAELEPKQDAPPTSIVRSITERAANTEDLGVVWRDPKSVEHFEKNVLASGTRRNTFAGKTFNWIEGLRALRTYTEDTLRIDRTNLKNIHNQLMRCLTARIARSHGHLISHASPLSAADARARGLLLDERPPHSIKTRRIRDSSVNEDRSYAYYQVGPEWVDYADALARLSDLPNALIREALRDGRILAVRTEHGRSALVPPWQWNESTRFPASLSSWIFLSSHDLPPEWQPRMRQLRGPERDRKVDDIRKDIEKLYRDGAERGDKPKKDDLIRDLAEKHKAPQQTVKDAWKLAEIPEWKLAGRRKVD